MRLRAVCLAIALMSAVATAAPRAPTGMLTDLLAWPELGTVATPQPTFGWIVDDPASGAKQGAYRILVAASEAALAAGRGDLWDSGRVASSDSINLAYRGAPLTAGATVFWKVQTWDAAGAASPWSAPQKFTLADKLAPDAVSRERLVTDRRAPAAANALAADRTLLDFGRAAFGWLELTLESPEADRRVEIFLGEKLGADGRIDRKPPGSVRTSRIELTLAAGRRTYRVSPPADKRNTGKDAIAIPAEFGVVTPFRFAEVAATVAAADATQVALHYPFDERAANFHCDDEALNAVWSLCHYTMEATSFAGIYVDGDRERIPYEADAYLNQLGHYASDREFTLARASHDYLMSHPTWPTEWKQHSILLAWADYEQTGDARMLVKYYDALRRDKLLLQNARADGLLDTGKLRDIVDWPAGERDGYDFKPVNTVVNAFHVRTLALMARIAAVVGRADDAKEFSARADRVLAAFNATLFDAAAGRYRDGEGSAHASLHASMFPLAFELVPPEHRARVAAFVKSRGMACSVYPAQYLLEGLFLADEADAAIALLRSDGERSWRNMLRQGATIAWEAWDQRFKPNQDWNHAWGAVPGNILPRFVLGVRPLEPGFGRVLIAPELGPLHLAEGRVPTIRGSIDVRVNRDDAAWRLEVTLPANVSGIVVLSGDGAVMLDGRDVSTTVRKLEDGRALDVSAGAHRIEVKLKP